jgi:long-chain acyl-CoA synthetase
MPATSARAWCVLKSHIPAAEVTHDAILSPADWLRVCRDLAWSEISVMPGFRARIGPRIGNALSSDQAGSLEPLSWGADTLALDSLSRLQLATAAATWCNAFDSDFEDLCLAKRSVPDWADLMQRARAAGSSHFTFSTSGSTGVCKHVRHREEILADEARVWAGVLSERETTRDAFRKSTPANAAPTFIKRVVALCPTHHIYGFIWGVLLPRALGVPVVDADLACLPVLESGDLIVAVPDQWGWLAESARHWPADVQGVTSTAPLPDAVHRALMAPPAQPLETESSAVPVRGRLRRLLQIYGSTETAGLAYRTAPDEPYTLAPQRSRSAAGGIALTLPDGSVVSLDVQDDLQWISNTDTRPAFHILRRRDLSVQVGGHNVSPAWVADQLRLHPAVSQASVRLSTLAKPPRLKAFVVLNAPGSAAQCQALEQWCSDTLPWYANFSSITYGREIPANAVGKPSEWQELNLREE